MVHLITGTLSLAVGILLEFLLLNPIKDKDVNYKKALKIIMKEPNLYGSVFTMVGIINILRYIFGIDTISWTSGTILFIASIAIEFMISACIKLIITKRSKNK